MRLIVVDTTNIRDRLRLGAVSNLENRYGIVIVGALECFDLEPRGPAYNGQASPCSRNHMNQVSRNCSTNGFYSL